MRYESRRRERIEPLISAMKKDYKHFIDLTPWEAKGEALEGKGSLVIDNKNLKIYCTLSNRSSKVVLDDLVK